MPSFLDLFAPEWQEQQRQLARQRFQAGLQQPELFNTKDMPIPQMAQDYEKGYGVPYPTQRMPSPTAAIEGMTTDPNRGTTIAPVPPENMPIEYVQPRSAQDMAMRGAGIQGQALGQKRTSELDFYRGLGEDYFGEEDIDLPSTAGFKRYEPTTPGESQPFFGERKWDPKVNAYVQSAPGQPDEWSPKATQDGGGTGEPEQQKEYEFYAKIRSDAAKGIDTFITKVDPMALYIMKQMGITAENDPTVVSAIRGKLSSREQEEIRKMMMQITWANDKISKLTIGKQNDPAGILQPGE